MFYGIPWCPSLSNWAFYGDKQLTEIGLIKDTFDTMYYYTLSA